MLNKLLGVVFFINFVNSEHGAFMDSPSYAFMDSPSYREEINITCISHDTKFTCDCRNADEKMFLPPLYGYVYHVSVSNCKWLSVSSYAISETRGLRSVSFTNIDNLVLQKNSLTFPSNTPLILEFNKFTVEEIQSHAINGNIEEIVFTSGKIGTIRPFAFTSLKDRATLLKFHFVQINKIEPQAFKKFSIDYLEFSSSTITSDLPSKSLYEVEVLQYFKIYNTTLEEVNSKTFSFKAVSKVILADNFFKKVSGEWLEAPVLEDAVIRNNHFEQLQSPFIFKAISVHKRFTSSDRMELRFINNTLHYKNEIFSLEFDNKFKIILKELFYVNSLNCQCADKAIEQTFFKSFSDTIYFKSDKQGGKYSTLAKILELDCIQPSYWIYIVVGSVSFILSLIIIVTLLMYLYIKKKKNKNKLDIVVPEPRTYRETQIVLQIENAGLLKTDL